MSHEYHFRYLGGEHIKLRVRYGVLTNTIARPNDSTYE